MLNIGTIQDGKSRNGMNNGVQHILSTESTKVLTKVGFKERIVASRERMMYANIVTTYKNGMPRRNNENEFPNMCQKLLKGLTLFSSSVFKL